MVEIADYLMLEYNKNLFTLITHNRFKRDISQQKSFILII